MREANAKPVMEIRAEGRIWSLCVRRPCALCGRDFDLQNGQARLVVRDPDGDRACPVCFRCTSAGSDELAERLLSRARQMKNEATKLEAWADDAIRIHPNAIDAAIAVQTCRKVGS